MKQDLEQRTGYEAPALTTVSFRTEKGFAASGKGGVTDYINNPSEDW